MGDVGSILSRVVATAVLLAATAAHAQRPICAPLGPEEAVQPVCAAYSLFAATRFAADFTVDHLFKPAPPAVQRNVVDMSQIVAGKQLVDNPALRTFLAELPPLRFSQLDRSTGSLIADFSAARRQFEGKLVNVEGDPTVTLRLPAILQGGYWRAPDVLQIAFWQNERVGIRTDYGGGRVFDAEVECMALSPDALLVRFASKDATPLLVQFRECDQ